MGGWARARAGAPGPVVGGAVVVGGVGVARVVCVLWYPVRSKFVNPR